VDERNWIVVNDKRILGLPPEARVSCSAVKSDIPALAHASERFIFIGFRVYQVSTNNSYLPVLLIFRSFQSLEEIDNLFAQIY
jgi:hypothetical protein